MDENVAMLLAGMYALIVAMSYRKVGFFAALLWPLTIIIMGTIVYLSFTVSSPPEQ